MLNEKLMEILKNERQEAVTMVTMGQKEPHITNTWKSYITVEDNKFIIPVGGMKTTEENLKKDSNIQISIASPEVQGFNFMGTGVLIRGIGEIKREGNEFDFIKSKFEWANGALIISIKEVTQTL
ncbi:MAG: pyridoxamine 5'-phosphate oxidase family protein [Cetobacterium sp.]|nr:pyridoxamine 5'-phosphate oxidase family protein [Cetobacterium sp.]